MIVKKGTVLTVTHQRKGKFIGIAQKDFDSKKADFYPIALAQEKAVAGMVNVWEEGESIPCRNTLCSIKLKV